MKSRNQIFILLIIFVILNVGFAIFTLNYSYKYHKLTIESEHENTDARIDALHDVNILKHLSHILYEQTLTQEREFSDMYKSFSIFLFSMTFLNILLVFRFYKYSVSNKALNPTGAEDAPPG